MYVCCSVRLAAIFEQYYIQSECCLYLFCNHSAGNIHRMHSFGELILYKSYKLRQRSLVGWIVNCMLLGLRSVQSYSIVLLLIIKHRTHFRGPWNLALYCAPHNDLNRCANNCENSGMRAAIRCVFPRNDYNFPFNGAHRNRPKQAYDYIIHVTMLAA